jgi:2-polyprenyl-3-methyl-5-hydroxy-6-metoxy-1,4-benzoquinol methylase
LKAFYIAAIAVGLLVLLMIFGYMLQGAFYAPTGDQEIKDIKSFLKNRKHLKIIDIGSGDGRIVAALAELGHEVTGIELNPLLYRRSLRKWKNRDVQGHMRFINGNFWKHDLSDYDVVVVYGIPHIMVRLETKMRHEMKPNSIVLSNDFFLPNARLIGTKGRIRMFNVT